MGKIWKTRGGNGNFVFSTSTTVSPVEGRRGLEAVGQHKKKEGVGRSNYEPWPGEGEGRGTSGKLEKLVIVKMATR